MTTKTATKTWKYGLNQTEIRKLPLFVTVIGKTSFCTSKLICTLFQSVSLHIDAKHS